MTYLRRMILGLVGALMTVPSAQALSCAQPDISRELQTAIASDKIYYILVGQITTPKVFTLPREKQTQKPNNGLIRLSPQSRSQTVAASFTGYSLAKEQSSDVPLTDFPITVNVTCAASWCGSMPRRNEKLIAFVEVVDGEPPMLTRGPCPAFSHAYDQNAIEVLRAGL